MSPKDVQDSQIKIGRMSDMILASSVHKTRLHVVEPPEEEVRVVSGLVEEALQVVEHLKAGVNALSSLGHKNN